ncbi:hypothetical protein CRG98_019719 [Punica granatum]|uniref:Uncharacterized protein n=1 Tax=Punica granatum TaxID=22663 RepID=A0A2I0JWU2_PUNGR|nr:hypothetical protein CRG98_019719 [Punica granatum]
MCSPDDTADSGFSGIPQTDIPSSSSFSLFFLSHTVDFGSFLKWKWKHEGWAGLTLTAAMRLGVLTYLTSPSIHMKNCRWTNECGDSDQLVESNEQILVLYDDAV